MHGEGAAVQEQDPTLHGAARRPVCRGRGGEVSQRGLLTPGHTGPLSEVGPREQLSGRTWSDSSEGLLRLHMWRTD